MIADITPLAMAIWFGLIGLFALALWAWGIER